MIEIYAIKDKQLLQEIDKIKAIMITLATTPSIDLTYKDQYKEIRQIIGQGLAERGLEDTNYFYDLIQWQGKWSSGDLPTYNDRRKFVKELYAPIIEHISNQRLFDNIEISGKPTGWTEVDRKITEIKKTLSTATNTEQYQSIGLICRDTLIALAQEAFDPSKHSIPAGTKKADVNTIIPAIINAEMSESSDERIRSYVRSTWQLVNHLQHKSTADYRLALLNVTATLAFVQIVAIITGKFDR